MFLFNLKFAKFTNIYIFLELFRVIIVGGWLMFNDNGWWRIRVSFLLLFFRFFTLLEKFGLEAGYSFHEFSTNFLLHVVHSIRFLLIPFLQRFQVSRQLLFLSLQFLNFPLSINLHLLDSLLFLPANLINLMLIFLNGNIFSNKLLLKCAYFLLNLCPFLYQCLLQLGNLGK